MAGPGMFDGMFEACLVLVCVGVLVVAATVWGIATWGWIALLIPVGAVLFFLALSAASEALDNWQSNRHAKRVERERQARNKED